MATQHISSAPHAPASPRPYPMANPGYGKRSMPGQLPRRADDFALLPARERYVAGFIDRLPDGASMDVKSLAKQLPLYGQQAVGSALKALATAGYLRRVRCLVGELGQVRWVSRTFWSRTARDNEWWAATTAEVPAVTQAAPAAGAQAAPPAAAPDAPSVPAASAAPTAPGAPVGVTAGAAPAEPAARTDPAPPAVPPATGVPRQRTPAPASAPAPGPAPGPAPEVGPSPAYLALARLGHVDSRLALSAADCAVLEERAAEWLARGVDTDHLTHALTAGLPANVGSPVGLVRRRLADKIPPYVDRAPAPPAPGAPVHRVMLECARCGAPGRAEALPDGLCRPCRRPGPDTAPEAPVARPSEEDVRTLVAGLRDLLKSP
ncbi:MarR family transcriptional regulator [Streptomyces sp. NPDC006288]|uniref:MarR family transcriptional regulator n=1 Tax=Streptomyces sp. NPDC006288 TaxID=3156743 RepID=UPI0033B14071